jgi:hypothetical protein
MQSAIVPIGVLLRVFEIQRKPFSVQPVYPSEIQYQMGRPQKIPLTVTALLRLKLIFSYKNVYCLLLSCLNFSNSLCPTLIN